MDARCLSVHSANRVPHLCLYVELNDSRAEARRAIQDFKFCLMLTLKNTLLLPIRLSWNFIVTILIVAGFVLWLGFIFGSVIAVILILIFKPELFLLPLVLTPMYTEIWPEN